MKINLITSSIKKYMDGFKNLVPLIILGLFFNAAFAQNNAMEEIEIIQDVFGSEKRMIIQENVDLTGVDTDKFWKLYDEYEVARKELGKEKMDLLNKYTTQKGAVSVLQADALMKKAIPLRAAEDNLILKYTKKINKATNSVVAVQFYQIEHYISDGIRFTILDNINFIQDK